MLEFKYIERGPINYRGCFVNLNEIDKNQRLRIKSYRDFRGIGPIPVGVRPFSQGVSKTQPHPQGAFPRPTSKVREKRPEDEVE